MSDLEDAITDAITNVANIKAQIVGMQDTILDLASGKNIKSSVSKEEITNAIKCLEVQIKKGKVMIEKGTAAIEGNWE